MEHLRQHAVPLQGRKKKGIERASLDALRSLDKKNGASYAMSFASDHSHMCEHCGERFSCPVEKHDCKIAWRTSHNDHYLALSC